MPEYNKHDDGTATCQNCGQEVHTKQSAAIKEGIEWIGIHSCESESDDQQKNPNKRDAEDADWQSYYERLAEDCPYC